MIYSCAIFKTEGENLKVVQLRKISLLIEKATISKDHHILEIGFGWGTLAIEVVKRTGCKYTGITLSEEQLKYAELKVKEAGLQDHIKFILCDYRKLPNTEKYDRIISIEVLEHVGHEFVVEFFRCCESVLAEDGLLVLQVATEADIGLADAYINGDFSFADKNEGLLNLFMIFIANRDLNTSTSEKNKRGWWTPLFLTSAIASAKYFYHHVSRKNMLTQARRNISRHYDLSNELFSLFMDETMAYSCAIFKTEGEDLKNAQQRKFSILIERVK